MWPLLVVSVHGLVWLLPYNMVVASKGEEPGGSCITFYDLALEAT